MTDKLYGLDDIPEGWELWVLAINVNLNGNYAYLRSLTEETYGTKVIGEGETPQLALHKAIQKAKGEA